MMIDQQSVDDVRYPLPQLLDALDSGEGLNIELGHFRSEASMVGRKVETASHCSCH
jgi:hypothetical protein